ncbi:hypothetical protein GCM10022251_62760 [Phytohabitans flavus]|uniref:Uncharacterized protein n=1 Tax=Phytohabitans flavus TaxID=1076124 RepID=A0A6F8Y542_9ACTN|nr:hypothetical protein [Phytohabitans flavus]BCB81232.1 hypothetical protein Pflav_076420 [Phytohabitans flavus]
MSQPPRRAPTPDAHVPQNRVVERVNALPGVQPLRIFPLLLPVWGVEIKTTIREAQPYEVFDQYLSRAIAEAGLNDLPSLAGFFGVEPALVERGVAFLTTIGHAQRAGEQLTLTDLGHRSVADGCRYVLKEDRQRLYFDGFTGAPMPRTHYTGTVWLDSPELKLNGRTEFHVINSPAPFRPDSLDQLLRRPDREDFNVPLTLTDAAPLEVTKEWLPVYVVECVQSPLVFIKALDGPDPLLSRVLAPILQDVLAAEVPADAERVWREWLDGTGFHDVSTHRLPNGTLRATLPARLFGDQFGWAKLGSFETRKHTFLQLWCDDAAVRRRAVLVRAGAIVRAGGIRRRDELTARLNELAAQLEVTTPHPHELLVHARAEKDDLLVAALEIMA